MADAKPSVQGNQRVERPRGRKPCGGGSAAARFEGDRGGDASRGTRAAGSAGPWGERRVLGDADARQRAWPPGCRCPGRRRAVHRVRRTPAPWLRTPSGVAAASLSHGPSPVGRRCGEPSAWLPATCRAGGGRLAHDEVVATRRAHDLLDMLPHRVGVDHHAIAGARIVHDRTEQHRPRQVRQGIGGRRHGWFLALASADAPTGTAIIRYDRGAAW